MPNNRIRELRLQRAMDDPEQWTVRALAARLRIAEETLSRWESGARRPWKRHQRALARALGVTVEQLGLDQPAADETRPL